MIFMLIITILQIVGYTVVFLALLAYVLYFIAVIERATGITLFGTEEGLYDLYYKYKYKFNKFINKL